MTGKKRRTLADLLKIARKEPLFKSLARIVGEKRAAGAVEMTYPVDTGLAQGEEAKLAKDFRLTLQKELNDVLAGHYDLGRIALDARTGRFAALARQGGFCAPADYGAGASDSSVVKAAKWVSFKSASLTPDQGGGGNPTAISAIEQAIASAAASNLWEARIAPQLHTQCAPPGTFDPLRGIMLGAKYPSTAGGQFLIEAAFKMMAGINRPATGAEEWHNVAGFLFGAIVRAHSFSDGNGRVARAAYAAAIIKGGLAFAAPTKKMEDEMCKLG